MAQKFQINSIECKKKAFLFLLALSSLCLNAQTNLDSLYTIWQDNTQSDSIRAKALDDYIWFGYGDSYPDSTIIFSDTLLAFSRERDLKKLMSNALNMKGRAFEVRSDYANALDYYQESLKIREEIGDKQGIANVQMNIGNIYVAQGDLSKALDYQQLSLKNLEEIGYKTGIANSLSNLGNTYLKQGSFQQALDNQRHGLKIREEIGDKLGISRSLGNIGNIYTTQGNYPLALINYKRSLKIQEEFGDKYVIAILRYSIGSIYFNQGIYNNSLTECQKSLNLSNEIGAIMAQKNSCFCLYATYKAMGNNKKALAYHEQFTVLNDSIFNEESTKKQTQLEMQYEFDKKEAAVEMEQEKKNVIAAQELKRKKLERNGFMAGFVVVLLFAGVFFRQRNRIGKEKVRSEELLQNILPKEVAEELKEKGQSDAQLIDNVTILFTDIKGFTALSEQLSPKELVENLHECFSDFDRICEKYGIEKIKTIGDSYMAAGGLPSPNTTHAQDVVKACLEMVEVIKKNKAEKSLVNRPLFQIRIGVNTGPVVAGIVGVKKFQYDIWGDTVNIASRMESSGEIGKVNISEATYNLLKDDFRFQFESRGKIQTKGKGEMEMYFVETKLK